jgi:hypothetical protein
MKGNTNTTELVDRARDENAGDFLAATTDNTVSAVVDVRTSPKMDSSASRASELRARAERYRMLAETLSTTSVIAAVQGWARELEAQAASIEAGKTPL